MKNLPWHLARLQEGEPSLDDLGGINDFDEPVGYEGQHVHVRIPQEDWEEADARDQRMNGRGAVIVRVDEEDEPAHPASYVIMFDESNGDCAVVPREWLVLDPVEDEDEDDE